MMKINLSEEHALYRASAFVASVVGLGLLCPVQPASAAPIGSLPALAAQEPSPVAKAQFWDDPGYGYGRRYYDDYDYRPRRYGPPAYGPPPRYRRPPPARAYAPSRRVAPPVGRTGCYTPPPMPYKTPRVVCRY